MLFNFGTMHYKTKSIIFYLSVLIIKVLIFKLFLCDRTILATLILHLIMIFTDKLKVTIT